MSERTFLSGVVEGFYGQPWSETERVQLFDWMQAWRLNTYVYAPKDDLKHRVLWRENYTDAEVGKLAASVRACRERGITFVFALGPGLNLRYEDAAEVDTLRRRFAQLLALGGEHFALLFDDIPDRSAAPAAAHAQIANAVFRWLRERSPRASLAFCPTPYCGRMVRGGVGGAGYLDTLGRELAPEIDVFWTGPEIISREITVEHVRDIARLLRRPPLIWDNLHANDYDGRRFYCGPYAGRPAALRGGVRGLLVNPNCEFPLNFVPLRTLAAFVSSAGVPAGVESSRRDACATSPAAPAWDARAAYLAAMREWWPHFETVGAPLRWEDFVLFGDCFYLPHEEGGEAEAFFQGVAAAVRTAPAEAVRRRVAQLREFCARLAELRARPLFHALGRRAWELREELDLLERYLASPGRAVASDFHLPGTFRGGLVARLQPLLAARPDGTFAPP